MLVALDASRGRTIAAHGLVRDGGYRCPECEAEVLLKAGRKVVAHFAHRAGSACAAGGESHHHLAAKRILHDALTARGLHVELEAWLGRERRVDVLVRGPSGGAIAIEVQESPISVEAMKARERADRRAGCHTCWIFTERRVPAAVWEPPPWPARVVEARLPDELLWRWHLTRMPVPCLHVDRAELHGLELSAVVRPAAVRRLRSTVNVVALPLAFSPRLVRGQRYGNVVATFASAR